MRIICIKDFKDETYFFKKNKKYEIKYKDVHIFIYDDNGISLKFNKYSFFGQNIAPKHFITHKKLRKQKLKKLYETT